MDQELDNLRRACCGVYWKSFIKKGYPKNLVKMGIRAEMGLYLGKPVFAAMTKEQFVAILHIYNRINPVLRISIGMQGLDPKRIRKGNLLCEIFDGLNVDRCVDMVPDLNKQVVKSSEFYQQAERHEKGTCSQA